MQHCLHHCLQPTHQPALKGVVLLLHWHQPLCFLRSQTRERRGLYHLVPLFPLDICPHKPKAGSIVSSRAWCGNCLIWRGLPLLQPPAKPQSFRWSNLSGLSCFLPPCSLYDRSLLGLHVHPTAYPGGLSDRKFLPPVL